MHYVVTAVTTAQHNFRPGGVLSQKHHKGSVSATPANKWRE